MKILNYRSLFACNSSSTHSVIIANKNRQKIKEKLYRDYFGWENFVLSTPETLEKYIAGQIWSNLDRKMPEYLKLAVIKHYFPDFSDLQFFINRDDAVIDHQSVWNLPPTRNGFKNYPSEELVKDIISYIKSKNIIILGGTDEDEHLEKKINKRGTLDLNFEKFRGNIRSNQYCQRDGKVWKYFNYETGEKIRFTFDDNIVYDHSSTPELIDLIISNQCQHNCRFCYRRCEPSGGIATVSEIDALLYRIMSLDTFEIAIGGGDLLIYPDLDNLLHCLRIYKSNYLTIFNTTLNMKSFQPHNKIDFAKNLNILSEFTNTFSSIAFSIQNISELEVFINYIQHLQTKNCYFAAQFIPELIEFNELKKMFEMADDFDIPIMLLGYKKVGRGTAIAPYDLKIKNSYYNENQQEFIQLVLKSSETIIWNDFYPHLLTPIGVDTQFLKNFPNLTEKLWDKSFHTEEGKFSCCVDAVNKTVSASSFSKYKIQLPTCSHEDFVSEFKNIFQRF